MGQNSLLRPPALSRGLLGGTERKPVAFPVSAGRLAFGLLLCLSLAGLPLRAEPGAADDRLAQRLSKALLAARETLKQEQERVEKERQALDERVKKLETAGRALSDEVVDLRVQVSELRKEDESARQRRDSTASSALDQQADAEKVERLFADSLDRVEGHLRSLVSSSRRPDHQKRAAELRNRLRTTGSGPEFLKELLGLFENLLAEGRCSEVYESDVQTAGGIETRARLLRLGHVGLAYIAPDRRVGLALRAPDGEGYRWLEELSRPMRNAILDAGRPADGSPPDSVAFPLDVTRSMAKERQTGQMGFGEWFRAGGLVMYPLAAVACLALLLILERLWFFSQEGRASQEHASAILGYCQAGDVAAAEAYCEGKRGPVVRALHACLKHRDQSVVAMEDSIQEAILHELPRLERFLSALSVLATIAPLLGLLGTITGMMYTFDMIAVHGSGDARLMAGGISEALITTEAGLIIAIPILLVHSVLAGKTERLIADTERFAASLLILLRDRALAAGPSPAESPDSASSAEPTGGQA